MQEELSACVSALSSHDNSYRLASKIRFKTSIVANIIHTVINYSCRECHSLSWYIHTLMWKIFSVPKFRFECGWLWQKRLGLIESSELFQCIWVRYTSIGGVNQKHRHIYFSTSHLQPCLAPISCQLSPMTDYINKCDTSKFITMS